jgi:hypothetical protein
MGFVVDKVELEYIFLNTSVSFDNCHLTDCSIVVIIIIIIMIIYQPGLVQYVKQWQTYQVDSVSPHLKKTKRGNYIFNSHSAMAGAIETTDYTILLIVISGEIKTDLQEVLFT